MSVAQISLYLQGEDCRHSGRRTSRADPESRDYLALAHFISGFALTRAPE